MLALASVLLVIESCAVPSTGAEKIGGFSLVGTWSGYYKIGSQWGNPEANLKLTIDEVVNDHVKGTWARYLSDSGGYECFNVKYPADGTNSNFAVTSSGGVTLSALAAAWALGSIVNKRASTESIARSSTQR